MLQRGKSRIPENVSVQALHERKQLNAKKIEQLKAKRSFVCFCFLFVFSSHGAMSCHIMSCMCPGSSA